VRTFPARDQKVEKETLLRGQEEENVGPEEETGKKVKSNLPLRVGQRMIRIWEQLTVRESRILRWATEKGERGKTAGLRWQGRKKGKLSGSRVNDRRFALGESVRRIQALWGMESPASTIHFG